MTGQPSKAQRGLPPDKPESSGAFNHGRTCVSGLEDLNARGGSQLGLGLATPVLAAINLGHRF